MHRIAGRIFLVVILAASVVPARAADDAALCAGETGDEAIAACTRLIDAGRQKGAELGALYRHRCVALVSKWQADRAISDCNDAVRLDSGNRAAFTARGHAWRIKHDNDRAIADLDQAIRLDPKHAPAYVQRCIAWVQKNERDRALADCEEALRLDPSNALAYSGRCFAWWRKNEPDRAMADCNEGIRRDPKAAAGYNLRALVWAEKRDYDRAIADYDEAIRLDGNYAAAYSNRAAVWRNKRDVDRALGDYDQAIRLDPGYAVYRVARGLAWTDKRDFDRAIADYDEAIRLDPRNANAFFRRGDAWRLKRDYDRAIADAGEGIRLNPKFAAAFNLRGLAFRTKGDNDRAIADFTEAARIDPKFAIAYANRGITHLSRRDYDRAIADLDEAIRVDSGFTAAFTNRGIAFERKGDAARARADFNAALALPPKYDNGKWAHDTARERLAALDAAQPGGATPAPATPAAPPAAQQPAPKTAPRPGAVRRIALLIANSNYPDADPPLVHPRNDARLLADELKASGFEVEFAENLSRQQLQDATERFKKKVGPNTAALLYYAGFAIQSARKSYMIPVNAQVWTERDVARDGVSIESVLSELADDGNAVKLLIVDASRRNPFERRFRSGAAGLGAIVAPPNSLVISAGGLGQVIDDGSGNNSLFMTELLKEARSPSITLEEVFSRARIGVSRATDGEQVPWVSSSLRDTISLKPGEERRSTR